MSPETPAPPSGESLVTPSTAPLRAGERCIQVRKIEVKGVHLLSAGGVARTVRPFEGRCLGLAQINGVLQALTFAYVRRGYITARAYLPEQDLSGGVLRVAVVEGRLAAITMNGSAARETGERLTAFPHMVGRPLNLRDVEQGLEQMSRLPGVDARMSIRSGRKPGESVLAVQRKSQRRLYAQAGSDNLGSDSTGIYQDDFDLSLVDPLGLNDQLRLGYQRSMVDGPLNFGWHGPHGDGWSGRYDVPWGYWTFGLFASRLGYHSQLAAPLGPIPTSGTTDTIQLFAKRVIARDRVSKTTLTGALTWTDIRSYILGSRIDVASYRLAVLRLELAHDRRLWGGVGRVALGGSWGLNALGAFNDAAAPAGSPQGQFGKADLSASFRRRFHAATTVLDYEASLSGQWSDDRLFSSEQMSVGGPASVRGVREALLFGDRSAVLRQTVAVPVVKPEDLGSRGLRLGTVEAYAGIDAGHVWGQPADGIAGGTVAGATVGLRSRGGPFRCDVSYSRIVARSAGVVIGRNGLFALGLSMAF